jgi:hypothetical protein
MFAFILSQLVDYAWFKKHFASIPSGVSGVRRNSLSEVNHILLIGERRRGLEISFLVSCKLPMKRVILYDVRHAYIPYLLQK